MRPRSGWSWVGACSVGTSHLKAHVPCDDAGACVELASPSGPILVAAVSDGAGSAPLSRFGSRIVVREFCRSAAAFIRFGGLTSGVDEDLALDWLDGARDRIQQVANRMDQPPRFFAATLVGSVIGPEGAVVVHVGDGACAVRLTGEAEWRIPSWPAQGEYAATTNFVTDDPQPRLSVRHIEGTVEEIAVFTDGLERLALDFVSGTAFQRFFETMFPALRKAGPGRRRALSSDLRAFLDSPMVVDRTDDDKTLIMARRMTAISDGLVAPSLPSDR